ncbi:NAD(P)H-binding protein [Streptomyces sp. DSM 44917]|uniref:NAD(P)H-binding protein n=1 Tax=Streptomyces boetiae TaxID=3075541 RepID=A0ABU2LCM0_9ACTN|nr:NmrA family NAD(P)-binding protein [Streptomyces sp. DSM 44917]MDT0308918.1 NAD(P)H-binding protein [Streptomyces sp. DSM 44917]
MTSNANNDTAARQAGARAGILVLGGTGKTGRRVVARLRQGGHEARAASRSGETRFDWADKGSWEPALKGARAVYVVAPDDPAPVGEFVDLAVASGAERLLVLSGRGIDHATPYGFGDGMAEAERAARASGVAWTVIQANNFNQNFSEDLWLAPLRAGRLALPIGDEVPEPFVDVDDLAEAAARILAAPGDAHAGEVYEVTGPRDLTWREATEVMARAAGREIAFEELSPEAYRAQLLAEGWPEEAVRTLNALFAVHRAGHTAGPADGVERVLGRPPVAFESWAERNAAVWR